jgi:hypothetical protein
MTQLDINTLDTVTGGVDWGKVAKKAGKFVAKKALGPISAAWTGYDAVDGYLDARENGDGVLKSVGKGAMNAVL